MERDKIIDWRSNEGSNTRRKRDNNKIRIDTNNNQGNYFQDASAKIWGKLDRDGSTTTGSTGSILLSGIYT